MDKNFFATAFACTFDIDQIPQTVIDCLPPFRKQKCDTLIKKSDKLVCAAAWHLLRYAIKSVCKTDMFFLDVALDRFNKPYFAGSDIHFNISHTDFAAACIIDNNPCGIDIERQRTFNQKIIRRYAPHRLKEFESIKNPTERDILFTKFWTNLESMFKANPSHVFLAQQADPKDYNSFDFMADEYFVCAHSKSRIEKLNIIQLKSIL